MILTKGKIKEFNIELFIENKISANELDTVLIIVPTNRRQRSLKKKIIDNFRDEPVSVINIETISTLADKLLSENLGFTSLSEAASSVLIRESAETLDLNYFAAYSKGIPFGTLEKIKNVISEYKRHGISPERLLAESSKLSGGEKKKACDISAIYSLYLQKCRRLSAFEIGDVYSALLDLDRSDFLKTFIEKFPSISTIILDGFDEFSNLEIKIIDLLSASVDDNLIVSFDYSSSNESLFAHLTETYNILHDYGFIRIKDLTPIDQDDFRNNIRTNLFKHNQTRINKKYKNIIFKNRVNNRIDELELIAKTIKLEVLNNSISPENICVAFNNIGNYSSNARDVFTQYGIPFNLSDRLPLKTSQPVIAALSLLELAENDFDYNHLLKVLTNGFLEIDTINLNNIISVANDLKITRGLQNWESSIKDAISLLSFKNDITKDQKSAIIKNYKKAKTDIGKVSELLSPLKKRNSKHEFLHLFKKLLLHLRVPYTVLENASPKEEVFIKSITVLIQTLEEVLFLIDTNEENKKYSLQFYIDQIRTIANWARFNTKEKSDYGVLITSVNEIRGLKFDYLFLAGMCDGDFPTKYSPEIFFSGSFQKKEQLHQTEERYHFYQALCSWNKKLFLSIPNNNAESELVESTFIKDIEKLFEFSELETDLVNNILTNEELQIKFATYRHNNQLKGALSGIGLNSNELISRSEIKKERKLKPFEEYQYSGFINSGDEEIEEYLVNFSNSQFSISQLETFAKCPFKYFSERILKISPIEEPNDEAAPIELGNVLHSILYEFYSTVKKEKIVLSPKGSPEFEKLKKLIFEIAEDKIKKLNLNSPIAFFEKEKILGIEGKKENSILYKFLIEESTVTDDFNPTFFESSFGKFSIDSENFNEPFYVDELKLRGKIDRIDLNENELSYNIIDYKLKGRKPTRNDLESGISLQLPIYLMAGKQIVEKHTGNNYRSNKMVIYSLDYKNDNFGPTEISLSRKRNLDVEEINQLNTEQIEGTKEKILEYYNSIKNGKFNLSSLDDRESKVCRYCDYRSFCRMQEVFEA